MKSPKPVRLRALALTDVDEAIAYYLQEAGADVALGFIDALEQAYHHLARQPVIGSPRCAHELNLPGLRSWPLTRYPNLVFCVEQNDHVDVWRVLHGERDIPAWLSETDPQDCPPCAGRLLATTVNDPLKTAPAETPGTAPGRLAPAAR